MKHAILREILHYTVPFHFLCFHLWITHSLGTSNVKTYCFLFLGFSQPRKEDLQFFSFDREKSLLRSRTSKPTLDARDFPCAVSGFIVTRAKSDATTDFAGKQVVASRNVGFFFRLGFTGGDWDLPTPSSQTL